MSVFTDVPDEKVHEFYVQMILSDIVMPHTKEHLSPITFSQFLDRNQIRTFNVLPIYEEANSVWKEFSYNNKELGSGKFASKLDMNLAEQPTENSWHILIDFFRRLLKAETITEPYILMHYLAHVCRSFLEASSTIGDHREVVCTRAIFTQMTGPILYDTIIPAAYVFLPIKNYTDATFFPSVKVMFQRVKGYIECHTAQKMEATLLDSNRLDSIKKELHKTLSNITKHRNDQNSINAAMTCLANTSKIYKIDQDAYEMSDTMIRDGFRSANAIVKLNKLGDKFVAGKISSEPDELIDRLLDIWSLVSPPKKETLVSKIGSLFKKKPTEDMDNDIDAIKRVRKFDPS